MATNVRVVKLNPARLRVWVNRLPLCTRLILLVTVVFYVLSLFIADFAPWAALVPSKVSLWSAYRLNTYPVTFTGILHLLLSVPALIPLLDRFESEHGTLVTLALFTGPFSTLPGLFYIIIGHLVLRRNIAVHGPSVWIYILIACESIKTYRANPNFKLGTTQIPTYLIPLPLLIITHFLLPSSLTADSIILNASACGLGFAFELGYLKFLVPPEKALRFIEGKLNLLGRLPHYVSIDQKTFGRYGVLPLATNSGGLSVSATNVRGMSPARFAAVAPSPAPNASRP